MKELDRDLGKEQVRWQLSLKCPNVGLNMVCLGRSKQAHVAGQKHARRSSQQTPHNKVA